MLVALCVDATVTMCCSRQSVVRPGVLERADTRLCCLSQPSIWCSTLVILLVRSLLLFSLKNLCPAATVVPQF